MSEQGTPGIDRHGAVLLVPIPKVTMSPRDPLSAEMLEHWAAKLCLRNAPGDVDEAVKIQEAARQFREWQKANPF